jgi:hypothetical protein
MDIGARVKHITEGKLGHIVNTSLDWNLVLWDDGNVAPEGNESLEVIKEDMGRVQEEVAFDEDRILELMKNAGWGDAVAANKEDFEKSHFFNNPATEEDYAKQFDMYMNTLRVGEIENEDVGQNPTQTQPVDPNKPQAQTLNPNPDPSTTPTAQPLPTLNPQDKITISGIPNGDQMSSYNGKQAVVVSAGPEGTTLNVGGQNVVFNKPQYLKKLNEKDTMTFDRSADRGVGKEDKKEVETPSTTWRNKYKFNKKAKEDKNVSEVQD